VNLIIALIVPRSLGPASYGNFNFLVDTSTKIVSSMDLSMASAHFNYSSKYEDSKKATTIYFYVCLAVGIILLSAITIVYYCGGIKYLWPGQKIGYIYAGACLAYLIFLAERLTHLSDSKEATIGTEKLRVIMTSAGLVILLSLFFLKTINITTFFVYRITLFASIVVALGIYLKRKRIFDFRFVKLEFSETKKILKYFYSFSHPLIVLSFFGLLFGYFDRWFLQLIAGSVDQGFYSFAYRLSAVCFLFTGAMTPVFMQSVAKAHGQNNMVKIKFLFGKIKVFYFIAAFLSIFFAYHAKEIISVVVGEKYANAVMPLTIMLLYPIHQTYGQLCGGMLFSLERTSIYRNINILGSVVGAAVTFFLLAPKTYLIAGLDMGAAGLSLKMIISQLVVVNLVLYSICRLIKHSFREIFFHQIIALIPLVAVGYFVICLVAVPLDQGVSSLTIIGLVFIRFLIYSLIILSTCFFFPSITGLKRGELINYKNNFFNYFKQIFYLMKG
jgi:O-antigen/teichoic acid export membrane protein